MAGTKEMQSCESTKRWCRKTDRICNIRKQDTANSKLSNHKNGSSRKQEADIQRGMHSPIKINEAFLWSATILGCALANPVLQMISLFGDCISRATPCTRELFIPRVSKNLQQTFGGQQTAWVATIESSQLWWHK